MRQTDQTISRELKRLRKFIDSQKDSSIETRVAWIVENTLQWATQNTVGWPKPLENAMDTAAIIRRDMKQ